MWFYVTVIEKFNVKCDIVVPVKNPIISTQHLKEKTFEINALYPYRNSHQIYYSNILCTLMRTSCQEINWHNCIKLRKPTGRIINRTTKKLQ